MHVAEAKHNHANQVAVLLTPSLNVYEVDPNTLKAFMYQDVPIELWRRFHAAEHGPESDVIFETEIKGQYQEKEIPWPAYMLLPVPHRRP